MYISNSVIIFIIVILLYVYNLKLAHPDYDMVIYNDIKHKVKSGDMLIFTSLDNCNQLFMMSYYTHVGIIYKENENSVAKFVESFNHYNMPFHPKTCSNGVAICDLETRINTYRGFVLYKELAKPLEKKANKDFADFITYAVNNISYDKNVAGNEIGKILFNNPFTVKTNCGQFTVLILIKLGLIDVKHFDNRRKHHLIWSSNLKKLNNNYYKTPIYVYSQYFKTFD